RVSPGVTVRSHPAVDAELRNTSGTAGLPGTAGAAGDVAAARVGATAGQRAAAGDRTVGATDQAERDAVRVLSADRVAVGRDAGQRHVLVTGTGLERVGEHGLDADQGGAGRGVAVAGRRSRVRLLRVLRGVDVGLHVGVRSFALLTQEGRNGNSSEDADDEDHDQQLDKGEALLAIGAMTKTRKHLYVTPV